MAKEQQSTIAVFPNESDNENAPDYTGVIEINEDLADEITEGGKLRVALWKSKSSKGLKYLSGAVQVAQSKEDEKPKKSSKRSKKVVEDDDEDF